MLSRDSILVKIFFIIFFLCVTITLISTPSATFYESSIYSAYPSYFWGLLVLAIAVCTFITIQNAFSKNEKYHWSSGIFYIFMINEIILLLPLLRGYTFYGRTDSITHLGYINDIISAGHFYSNFYPLSHILIAMLSLITNGPMIQIFMASVAFYYLMYVLGIYLLCREISYNLGQSLLLVILSVLLPVGVYDPQVMPIQIMIFLMPIVSYLIFKRISDRLLAQFRLIFIIMVLSLIFYHPFSATQFIAILLIYACSKIVYSKILNGKIDLATSKDSIQLVAKPILIILISFLIWAVSFWLFRQKIFVLFNWLMGEGRDFYLSHYQNGLHKANLSLFQIFDLIFKTYGFFIIYTIIFILSLLIIFANILYKRRYPNERVIFFLFVSIILGSFSIFSIFAGFDIFADPFRSMSLVYIFVALTNGLILFDFISERSSLVKNILLFILTIFLVTSSSIGTFNTHPSPIIKMLADDVSLSEFSGGIWIAKNSDPKMTILPVASQFDERMRDYVMGMEESEKAGKFASPPPHFGYDSSNFIGNAFNHDVYTAITSYDRMYYSYLWPYQGSFNMKDLEKLYTDRTANLIYVNKGFDSFYISGRY